LRGLFAGGLERGNTSHYATCISDERHIVIGRLANSSDERVEWYICQSAIYVI